MDYQLPDYQFFRILTQYIHLIGQKKAVGTSYNKANTCSF